MYATIEADIRKGKVFPLEPDKLPKSGRALLVIMDKTDARRPWGKVRSDLGWLKTDLDPSEWQSEERNKW